MTLAEVIVALKARARAATPGPLEVYVGEVPQAYFERMRGKDHIAVVRRGRPNEALALCGAPALGSVEEAKQSGADATWFAAMDATTGAALLDVAEAARAFGTCACNQHDADMKRAVAAFGRAVGAS